MGRYCSRGRGGTYYGVAPGPSSLLSGLVAHWGFGSGTATAVDSVGLRNLDLWGTCALVEGKVKAQCNQFVSATTDFAERLAAPFFDLSQEATTIAGWFALDSLDPAPLLILQWNDDRQLEIRCDGLNLVGIQRDSADPFDQVLSTIELETSVWYRVLLEYRQSDKLFGIQVNQEAEILTTCNLPFSALQTHPVFAKQVFGTEYLNGRLDSWSLWNRQLTNDEKLDHWNGGAGKAYPF